ncbi:MAG: class I SAM-dependent methyltransferase [Defluviitaleaceae bacterium]|nr:class I SAM-dependent methyltransferase [Defluviitaleaceae bacterium]
MNQTNYYQVNLNANQLYEVYQTELPKVRVYLDAEIAFVRDRLRGTECVLELGAGYGRIMKELAPFCSFIYGIEISEGSAVFGSEYLHSQGAANTHMVIMDAHNIKPNVFDTGFNIVLCMQNALSSMKVEPLSYISKIMSMLCNEGRAYISTYSEKFWEHRLEWFQEQASKGLLGKIDLWQTKNGTIVCEDGFKSITHSREQLEEMGELCGYPYEIHEVNESSIFLVISKIHRE